MSAAQAPLVGTRRVADLAVLTGSATTGLVLAVLAFPLAVAATLASALLTGVVVFVVTRQGRVAAAFATTQVAGAAVILAFGPALLAVSPVG